VTKEDLTSRLNMVFVFLGVGLAGLFGPTVWAVAMNFYIGWSVGLAIAFFRKWIWK
jgi:hypothetical protein